MPEEGVPSVSPDGTLISEILSPKRITLGLIASRRDDLFRELSTLLSRDGTGLEQHTALNSLLERERQGSTGIGHGIALPHGRLKGLTRSIGAFVTLARAMDYDAIDRKPVTIVFALLVPDNAVEEHLLILSRLAGIFRNHETRQQLLAAQNSEEICQCFARADIRATR